MNQDMARWIFSVVAVGLFIFTERRWGTFKKTDTPSNEDEETTTQRPLGSITLREAIDWVIAHRNWEGEPNRARDLRIAIDKIQQELMNKTLEAWGQRFGSDVFEQINQQYWVTGGSIDYADLWVDPGSTGRCKSGLVGGGFGGKPSYEHVHLKKSYVKL